MEQDPVSIEERWISVDEGREVVLRGEVGELRRHHTRPGEGERFVVARRLEVDDAVGAVQAPDATPDAPYGFAELVAPQQEESHPQEGFVRPLLAGEGGRSEAFFEATIVVQVRHTATGSAAGEPQSCPPPYRMLTIARGGKADSALKGWRGDPGTEEVNSIVNYRFGSWELDEEAGELRHEGQRLPIQPKPLALLTLLIQERHRIVPNDELLDRLWPDEVVTPNSLTRAVSVARSAIGDRGPSGHIRSYKRRGYRFHGEVVELGDEGSASAGTAAAVFEHGEGALPFVGREPALARLRAAWNRSARGRGGIVLVTGPAGIGKTRVTEIFEKEVAQRGGLPVRGRALEEEGEPAFWVWAQVLRRLHREDPESLAVPGLADSGELAALMPELGAPGGDAATRLPAEQRRFVFFDAVAQALRRAGRKRPLLVVFEDLHWADRASLRLLEHLSYELSGTPVMLLATLRDAPPALGGPSVHTQSVLRRQERFESIVLERLEEGDVEAIVCGIAGRPLPELAARLRARTDGVPLYLREACRRLIEAGALEDPSRLEGELPLGPVDWVEDALAGMSESCAEFIGAAAVVGREFPLPLVAAVAEVSREEALDLLDEAVRCGVVEAESELPGRYRFIHDLFREAAYSGLSPGELVRLHHRTAKQLERQHQGDEDRVIAELAHHFHKALPVADAERAFDYATRAAELAFDACAYEQAMLHGTQALAALEQFERADANRRLGVLLRLGEAARLSGEREGRRRRFVEALELARTLDQPEDFATAAIGLCDLAEWGVRDDLARSALEEAEQRLDHLGVELQARVLTRLGYLDALFDREAAEKRLRRAVKLARELGASDPLEEALYALHFLIGGPEGHAERIEILEELRGAASAARDPVASVIALLDVACDSLERGDPQAAADLRREADTTAGQPPHPRTVWHRLVYDTGVALMEGRLDEILDRAEEARALGRRIQHPYAEGCFVGHQTALHAVRREREQVIALLEPALGALQGPADWVQTLVARAYLAIGRRDEGLALHDALMKKGVGAIPRNLRWTSTCVELAHCCADAEDADHARQLIDLLAPFERHHAVMPMVVCYGGPVSWALARLYETLGRAADADDLFQEALASASALGARPTQAQIRLDHGCFLRRRSKRGPAREHFSAAAVLAADLGLAALERDACEQLAR